MLKNNFNCEKCGNKLEENGYTNFGFEKYKCQKCGENFTYKLVKKYKVFYFILIFLFLLSGIFNFIDGDFPINEIIFLFLLFIPIYKDFKIKKQNPKILKKSSKFLGIFFLILFIFGASMFIFKKDPIKFTENQKVYIGNWKGEGIDLNIRDGYLDYRKEKGSTKSSVSGPIINFDKKEFSVGIGFVNINFKINEEPHKELNVWKMKVDGNELSRYIYKSELTIPNKKELIKLSNDFTELFNNGVLKNNYEKFYSGISKTWQSETNINIFKKIFPQEKLKKFSFDGITKFDVIFTKKPYLDENNFLVLEGEYLSNPKLKFTYKFIYEYPEWKIIGFKY